MKTDEELLIENSAKLKIIEQEIVRKTNAKKPVQEDIEEAMDLKKIIKYLAKKIQDEENI